MIIFWLCLVLPSHSVSPRQDIRTFYHGLAARKKKQGLAPGLEDRATFTRHATADSASSRYAMTVAGGFNPRHVSVAGFRVGRARYAKLRAPDTRPTPLFLPAAQQFSLKAIYHGIKSNGYCTALTRHISLRKTIQRDMDSLPTLC